MKDNTLRHELTTEVMNKNLTVKETKYVVKLVTKKSLSPKEAIITAQNSSEAVKNITVKKERTTVPIIEYSKLEEDYKHLQQENERLKEENNKLRNQIIATHTESKSIYLNSPRKSTKEEGFIDKESRFIVVHGYDLPIPSARNTEKCLLVVYATTTCRKKETTKILTIELYPRW